MDEKTNRGPTDDEIDRAIDLINVSLGGALDATFAIVSRAPGGSVTRRARTDDAIDAVATAAAMATADLHGTHEAVIEAAGGDIRIAEFAHPVVRARAIVTGVDPNDTTLQSMAAGLGSAIMGAATQITLSRITMEASLLASDDGGGH